MKRSPSRRQPDRVATSVRLDRDLLDRLDAQCDKRVLGRNLIMARGIEREVERLEQLEQEDLS